MKAAAADLCYDEGPSRNRGGPFDCDICVNKLRAILVAATKLDIAHGEVACDNELRAAPTDCDAPEPTADVSGAVEEF